MSLFPCTDIDHDLFGHLDLPKCYQIMFVNKYYYEFYQIYKSMILKNKTRLASQIIKERITSYGFNYDELMDIVTEYQGGISGLLSYFAIQKAFGVNCNLDNCAINDYHIEIYAHLSKSDSYDINFKNLYRHDSTLTYSQVHTHPIEMYLRNFANAHFEDFRTTFYHCLAKNIVYIRVFKCFNNYIRVKFTLVNKSVNEYVFKNFDIDCCKIVHTKNNTVVYNIDNFITLRCNARFNELDNIDYTKLNRVLALDPFSGVPTYSCFLAFYHNLNFGSSRCIINFVMKIYPLLKNIILKLKTS